MKKAKSGMQMLTKATASLNKKPKAISVKPIAQVAKSAGVNKTFKNPALATKAKFIKKPMKMLKKK